MALDSGFYDQHDTLRYVLGLARARAIGPDLVLAGALAQVAARITPRLALPAIIADISSLTPHFGLVGPSGAGKSGAISLSHRVLRTKIPPPPIAHLGSGEGLIDGFLAPAGPRVRIRRQVRECVLLLTSEIDQLSALQARDNGTMLETFLRQLYMGEAIGNDYRGAEKRAAIPAHHARCPWVVGIQPGRADALYGPKAVSGGSAQRLVLFDYRDDGMKYPPPQEPDPPPPWVPPQGTAWDWDSADAIEAGMPTSIDWTGDPETMAVAPFITEELQRARAEHGSGRRALDPLDAHRGLNRLKVAGLLALLLDQGTKIDATVWTMAGAILDASDAVRADLLAELPRARRDLARQRGIEDAVRRDSAEEHRYAATMDYCLRHVRKHAQPDGCRLGCLQAGASRLRRPMVLPALQQLVDARQLKTEVRTADRRPDGEENRYWWLP